MDFRSARIIATLLTGHVGLSCEAFAQHYPTFIPFRLVRRSGHLRQLTG
jgi:hypothetical protein